MTRGNVTVRRYLNPVTKMDPYSFFGNLIWASGSGGFLISFARRRMLLMLAPSQRRTRGCVGAVRVSGGGGDSLSPLGASLRVLPNVPLCVDCALLTLHKRNN